MFDALLKAEIKREAESIDNDDAFLLPSKESAAKIERYKDQIEKKLKPQLSEYQKAKDEIYKELGQYQILQSTIEITREQKLKKMDLRFDVGHEFFMQAEALDLDRIILKVSRDTFVEVN